MKQGIVAVLHPHAKAAPVAAHQVLGLAGRDFEPLYLAIGPDQDVYVSHSDSGGASGVVLRFDGRTGAFIDVFAANVAGGPRGLVFAPGAR